MTPEQCRGARAMLGMSQNELASAACLTRAVVIDFERKKRKANPASVKVMRQVFEERGVEFSHSICSGRQGVMLKPTVRSCA